MMAVMRANALYCIHFWRVAAVFHCARDVGRGHTITSSYIHKNRNASSQPLAIIGIANGIQGPGRESGGLPTGTSDGERVHKPSPLSVNASNRNEVRTS
jgi:hypothetical protein